MVRSDGTPAHVPEGCVHTRPPYEHNGWYISEADAWLPMLYPALQFQHYEAGLPLPCTLCGLTTTHRHAVIT